MLGKQLCGGSVARINCIRLAITQLSTCGYAGRKGHKSYRHSHEEIVHRLGPKLVHQEAMIPLFAPVMGDYAYVFRSPDEAEIRESIRFILERV